MKCQDAKALAIKRYEYAAVYTTIYKLSIHFLHVGLQIIKAVSRNTPM